MAADALRWDSVDQRIARVIRYLAIWRFIAYVSPIERSLGEGEPELGIIQSKTPLLISLYSLGYGNMPIRRVLKKAGYHWLAAQINVDYGYRALQMFYMWVCYQMLLSLLNNASKQGSPYEDGLLFSLQEYTKRLGLWDDVSESLASIEHILGKAAEISPQQAALARDMMTQHVVPIIEDRLGLVEHFNTGSVPGMSISYPTVYRLARLLGELINMRVLNKYETDPANKERQPFEQWAVLDRLGITTSIPREVKSVRRAIDSLINRRIETEEQDYRDLDFWIDSFLAIVFGGLSDSIFRVSQELKLLPFLANQADEVPDALLRSVNNLKDETQLLGCPVFIDDITSISADLSEGHVDLNKLEEKTNRLVEGINTWLDKTIPSDNLEDISVANTIIFAHRFRSYWVPVDSLRINAFLAQFPRTLRWVGEDIIAKVNFFDEQYFTIALSSQLASCEWIKASNTSLCLLGGARKSTSHMIYLLRRDLNIQYRELRGVLNGKQGDNTIVFIDDCSLTGTQTIHVLSELLGVWNKRPYKYETPLSRRQVSTLRASHMVFVFAMLTNLAYQRLSQFLTKEKIEHRIEYAHIEPWLSDIGMEDLKFGKLTDAGGILVDPVRQLAQPIFCPWSRLSRPDEWDIARDFCAEVGFSLLDRHAAANNWTEERRRGSALGYSGMQGRLVFSHNVPKTTLTLLWASGTYQGRQWIPLFPSRD